MARQEVKTVAKNTSKAQNRRGSPEAIAKRRAGRLFNDVLGGRGSSAVQLDGRTEKRRQRLLQELEAGSAGGNKELKPLDVLVRVEELMELGETLGALKKLVKVRKPGVTGEALIEVVKQLHQAYNFRPETYRFVGISADSLEAAAVEGAQPRRGRPAKKVAAGAAPKAPKAKKGA